MSQHFKHVVSHFVILFIVNRFYHEKCLCYVFYLRCMGTPTCFIAIFVAPALAGRHRRASFRLFVRSSIRQHLTWVSCKRNSSYSFAPIVLKLCMCFPHGMRICMWIGHNCWISFCHFFDIVNLVIFHPDYIDSGYLL